MTEAELKTIARGNRYTDPNYPIGQDIAPDSLFANACRALDSKLNYRKTSYVTLASRFLGSKVDLSQEELQRRIGKEDWHDYVIDYLCKKLPSGDYLCDLDEIPPFYTPPAPVPPAQDFSAIEDRAITGNRKLVL